MYDVEKLSANAISLTSFSVVTPFIRTSSEVEPSLFSVLNEIEYVLLLSKFSNVIESLSSFESCLTVLVSMISFVS